MRWKEVPCITQQQPLWLPNERGWQALVGDPSSLPWLEGWWPWHRAPHHGRGFFSSFINYILEALCCCQLLLPSVGLSRTPSGAHPPAGEAVTEKHRIPSRRACRAGPPSLSFLHLLAGRPSTGTGNGHKNSAIDRSTNVEQLLILC